MIIPIGTNTFGHDFSIDLDLHTWMIGMSGVGKSTVQTNAFIQLIQAGHGGMFIDPHGPAVEKILRFIPRNRMNDVIYIDLAAEAVPGIIPQYKNPTEEKLFKKGIVSMLYSLHKDRWGDETERIIKGALDAITEIYGFINVPAIYLFLARDSFRKDTLSKCKNPMLSDFNEQYDEKLRQSEQMAKFSPPLNKWDEFVEQDMRSITYPEKSIDWMRAMNDRKIIVARLSKGEIGEQIACLVGAILVLNIKISALRRKKNDPAFYLAIDECQNFLGSVDFETFSSELRKYNIKLFLATQYLDHFPSLSALFGNFPNGIIYRVSGKDAMILEENYLDEGLAYRAVNLENYQFMCRHVKDGLPIGSGIITSKAKVKKLGDEPPIGAVIAESMRRWAVSKEKTENKVMAFLATSGGRKQGSKSVARSKRKQGTSGI